MNLENRQTRIKLMFAYLKHSLLVGVCRCIDCLGLSLHPLKKLWVSEQRDPDKIAQKRRLSWAFADHICDKHQLIWFYHARIQWLKKRYMGIAKFSMSHTHTWFKSRQEENAKISCEFWWINVLRFPFREYWWKGSMITDTFTINVHARVVVYMYLIFVMTGQNISNDGDKGESDVHWT